MFLRPQDISINQGLKATQEENALRKYLMEISWLDYIDESQFEYIGRDNNKILLGLMAGSDVNVKPFFNPISIFNGGAEYLIGDLRSSSRFDKKEDRWVINNPPLYQRDKTRLGLMTAWIWQGPRAILSLDAIQVRLYGKWISNSLNRRFALGIEQTMRMEIGACLFYLSLFTTEDKFDLDKACLQISRTTNYPIRLCTEVGDGCGGYMGCLRDFIDQFDNIVGENINLSGITEDVFITLLAGSWFGASNTLLIGEAVEYPSTFCALLYLGLTDRSSRSTGIGKLALSYEKNCLQFIKLTEMLLDEQLSTNYDKD